MNVLVTGASGFVGRALLAYFAQAGINTTAVVRRSVNDLPATKQLVVADLITFDGWQPALENIDVVVHCAGLAHTNAGEAEYTAVNTELSCQLAEACINAGVKRLVFLSSLKAVGEQTPLGEPFDSNSATNPSDAYGRSKRLAEQKLQALAANSSLELVIIRPPLVYGQGVKANFQLLMRIARLPVPLPFAGVNNRRSMISLDNLCSLITTCLSHSAAAGAVLMASDSEPYSLAQLLRGMRRAAGRPDWLFYIPEPVLRFLLAVLGQSGAAARLMDNLEVDAQQAQHLLSWQPPCSLDETLRKMQS